MPKKPDRPPRNLPTLPKTPPKITRKRHRRTFRQLWTTLRTRMWTRVNRGPLENRLHRIARMKTTDPRLPLVGPTPPLLALPATLKLRKNSEMLRSPVLSTMLVVDRFHVASFVYRVHVNSCSCVPDLYTGCLVRFLPCIEPARPGGMPAFGFCLWCFPLSSSKSGASAFQGLSSMIGIKKL
jgi:hypothetical protein